MTIGRLFPRAVVLPTAVALAIALAVLGTVWPLQPRHTAEAAIVPTETKLTASDGAAGDSFGISVAIDGDTAVVGAFEDDDAGRRSGSAFVFVRTGTTWSQQQKLTASAAAAGDSFGISVTIGGDTVMVGASGASGSAYVYEPGQILGLRSRWPDRLLRGAIWHPLSSPDRMMLPPDSRWRRSHLRSGGRGAFWDG